MLKQPNPIFLIALILLTLAACSPGPREYGTLAGQVTIGPLVPAMRVGEPAPTPAPEVYAAREIVVYKQNGKTEAARLAIDATGWYQGKLPVGSYLVDINHLGVDSAAGLPQQVIITTGAVYRLDIDIDTGIR